jgi:hypothetical protein
MFGDRQLEWLEETLRSPKAATVVVATGNQWLSTASLEKGNVETLTQYPMEYFKILEWVAASPSHVVLLSGDRHFGEIMELDLTNRRLLEITSSPISARSATAEYIGNEPLRKGLVYGKSNFGLLTLRPGSRCPVVKAELFDEHGALAAAYEPQC